MWVLNISLNFGHKNFAALSFFTSGYDRFYISKAVLGCSENEKKSYSTAL